MTPHLAAYEGVSGGRCGGSPPAQGRAAGPTALNYSGQWSVAGNVKGKGSIHEFARISTKNVNCGFCQGALRGESPRTREGRRPDRPNCRGQWPVVSGQELQGAMDSGRCRCAAVSPPETP